MVGDIGVTPEVRTVPLAAGFLAGPDAIPASEPEVRKRVEDELGKSVLVYSIGKDSLVEFYAADKACGIWKHDLSTDEALLAKQATMFEKELANTSGIEYCVIPTGLVTNTIKPGDDITTETDISIDNGAIKLTIMVCIYRNKTETVLTI